MNSQKRGRHPASAGRRASRHGWILGYFEGSKPLQVRDGGLEVVDAVLKEADPHVALTTKETSDQFRIVVMVYA